MRPHQRLIAPLVALGLLATAIPARAGPPEALTTIAFATPDRTTALARINAVITQVEAVLARAPADRDAQLQRSIALAYRAQLTRSAGDAKTARRGFEAILARTPNDAEALMALASWHLNSVADLGSFLAGAVLGANKKTGTALLTRALAAGGDRALFPAYAALLQLKTSPDNLGAARALAERAAGAKAPTQLDQVLKRRAIALLPVLRAGNAGQAEKLAKQLLPLGQISG